MNPAYYPTMVAPQGGIAMAPGATGMGMLPPPTGAGAMPVPIAGGYMVVPTNPVYRDTLDTLSQTKGLYVKEHINIAEVLTGCDMEHNFADSVHAQVSTWDPALAASRPKDGKGPEVMYMKEVSPCCERIMCGASRSFKIGVVPSSPAISTFHPAFQSREAMFSHPDGFVVDRPFRCTMCCLNRPVVYMKHNTLGRFATIRNPCTLCSYQFDIYPAAVADGGEGVVADAVKSESSDKWYTVRGTMCQPGVLCPFPCGECARVRLQVYDGKDEARTAPIGEVARVFPGWCESIVMDSDDFTIAFPNAPGAPLKRASLMASVILMNYLFYENKRKKNDGVAGGMLNIS